VKDEPKKDRGAQGAEENEEGERIVGKEFEVEKQATFSVAAAESVSRRWRPRQQVYNRDTRLGG
jgi:hypothetical protein